MKRKIIVFFILLFFLIISYSNKKDETIITSKEVLEKEASTETVNLLIKDDIVNLDLEEYVVGVVSCEMPASFNNEALKAMAVAARTYAKYKMQKNKTYDLKSTVDDQCYNTLEQMKKKWGKNYDKYYSKVSSAVSDTKNEYMTYNNEIVIAFYFSISNGYTENCENVFSQKLDYLVSVDSSWDDQYDYKESKLNFRINDFLKKINIQDNKIKSIDIKRSDTGRVDYISINGVSIKGTKFRTLLSLKSTAFEISADKNYVYITTKGYGHGVGMSQYGAEAMSKLGYTYDEILKHYYTGIKIVNN